MKKNQNIFSGGGGLHRSYRMRQGNGNKHAEQGKHNAGG